MKNATLKQLSSESTDVLKQAEHQARSLNHEYVGTEHVLLALAHSDTDAAHVLQSMGITAERVHAEIVALVIPGPQPVTLETIPLTPRASAAIQYAIDHANSVAQPLADPGHLLLGLLHEPSGVASLVLRKLGLNLPALEHEVLRIRIAQMKIVERVVRPLRTSATHKRKLREELLAHLTAIYNEEKQSLKSPAQALEAAAKRFGNPDDLAKEFDRDVPKRQRLAFYFERLLGWRSHETAARYAARIALYVAVSNTLFALLIFMGIARNAGWTRFTLLATLPMAAILYLVSIDVFVLGVLYYATRNTLHGAFGIPKSRPRLIRLQLAFAAVLFGSFLLMVLLSDGPEAITLTTVLGTLLGCAYCVWFHLALAREIGRVEIQDTLWATLDIAN